MVKNKNPT